LGTYVLKLLLAKAMFTLWLEIFISWQKAVSFQKVLSKRHLRCAKKLKTVSFWQLLESVLLEDAKNNVLKLLLVKAWQVNNIIFKRF
jgi:hypothetical protein